MAGWITEKPIPLPPVVGAGIEIAVLHVSRQHYRPTSLLSTVTSTQQASYRVYNWLNILINFCVTQLSMQIMCNADLVMLPAQLLACVHFF